ncbi:MAG: sigma-70 family RNA polymerase sigma factor [Pseudomonadota bacterium]
MPTPDNNTFRLEDLAEHRRYLFRYAIAQMRERDVAEELVQETLLAAVESSDSFQGKSSVRTWLTAILKYKIIDAKRRDAKSPVVDLASALDAEDDIEDFDSLYFKSDGHWQEPPPAWSNPAQSFENNMFWKAFEECLDNLPATTARAFYLREITGLETEDICKELAITTSNCWVMLYRARMNLRECLERRWFQSTSHRG